MKRIMCFVATLFFLSSCADEEVLVSSHVLDLETLTRGVWISKIPFYEETRTYSSNSYKVLFFEKDGFVYSADSVTSGSHQTMLDVFRFKIDGNRILLDDRRSFEYSRGIIKEKWGSRRIFFNKGTFFTNEQVILRGIARFAPQKPFCGTWRQDSSDEGIIWPPSSNMNDFQEVGFIITTYSFTRYVRDKDGEFRRPHLGEWWRVENPNTLVVGYPGNDTYIVFAFSFLSDILLLTIVDSPEKSNLGKTIRLTRRDDLGFKKLYYIHLNSTKPLPNGMTYF